MVSMEPMIALPVSSHLKYLFFDISEINSPSQNKSVQYAYAISP